MLFDSLNLGRGFKRYFEFSPATSEEARDQAFFIRHEVYCKELGYEPERENQRETDEYDRHSLQCLIRTANEERALVGCTRLVLARPDAPDYPLPFEKHCVDTLDRSIIDPARLPRDKIAEVSRLAVLSHYRRRKRETQRPMSIEKEDFGSGNQPRFPFIPVGLYLGSVAMAQRSGIEYLFTLTEPRLAEHFAKLGVNIKPIGGAVMHRGARIPSVMVVDEVVTGFRFFLRSVWREINIQIDRHIAETVERASNPDEDGPSGGNSAQPAQASGE